jgi:hypothetical protein
VHIFILTMILLSLSCTVLGCYMARLGKAKTAFHLLNIAGNSVVVLLAYLVVYVWRNV